MLTEERRPWQFPHRASRPESELPSKRVWGPESNFGSPDVEDSAELVEQVVNSCKPAPHSGKPQTVSISRIPRRRITLSVSEGTVWPEPRPLADAQSKYAL